MASATGCPDSRGSRCREDHLPGNSVGSGQRVRCWVTTPLYYCCLSETTTYDNQILPDLFQHSRGQVREEVSRRVAESGGKGCLIWLEAWDELPSDLRDIRLFL